MDNQKPAASGGQRAKTRVKDGRKSERNMALSVFGWFLKIVGTVLIIALTTGVMIACIGVVYATNYLNTDLEVNLKDFNVDLTSFVYVYDKEKQDYVVLEELYGNENRNWVKYDEVPEYVYHALIAIEDKRFYQHAGVDLFRTGTAFLNMFLGMKDSYGGSSITQQVIKNVTGEDEATVRRKLTEIFRALEFEKNHEDEEILELYINLVYFSQGCYGIEAAAQRYFGKSSSELTIAEGACIVGITNLPTYYDPYINRENNKKRQEIILYEMFDQGYITEKEYEAAIAQKLVFKRDAVIVDSSTSKYQSYFVDQVIEDVIRDLMAEQGISYKLAQQRIYNGGYSIYITMDTEIQAIIDEIYTNPEYWPKLADDGQIPDKPQSAIMVMDPYTGDVVGMYGGLGDKEGNRVLNRVNSNRQPGSSIKPLAVYAPALEAGVLTPWSVYTDMPVDWNGQVWPKNYDSGSAGFRGQMTVMEAVERSINTIPAQLVIKMGPQYCFEFAKYKMGLTTLVDEKIIGDRKYTDIDPSPLSLGGLTTGVNVRDMCEAYSVFTNQGIHTESRTYTKVIDSNGITVLDNTTTGVAAIKEKTAYYINMMLQSVVTNGTGVNARLSNMVSAGKTGTTTNDYDRWYVGYTPYYTCVVWYGFDENRTIKSATSPAVPLWKAVMSKVHENLEPREFFTPENVQLVKASFCRDSGHAPTEACRNDARGSRVLTGTFYAEDIPTQACTMHEYVSIDKASKQLATPFCPVEETVRFSLLRLDRYNKVQAIALNDEQYTVRNWTVPAELDENGNPIATEPSAETEEDKGFHTVAPNNKDGLPILNTFCVLHPDAESILPPEEHPEGEYPTEPDDGDYDPEHVPTTAEPEYPSEPDDGV